jgi:hypothetical protein
MAEFGKRNAVGGGAARSQFQAAAADLHTVVNTGKLPAWTRLGFLQLVIFMLALPAVIYWGFLPYAGDILRDHRLAGSWRTAYDLQALDGHCTRHQFLLTNCSAKIKSLAEPDQKPVQVDFMMGFVSGGGEAMIPVRSTRDSSVVSIGYAAQTELWNRTLTFLVMIGAMSAMFLATVRALLRGRYNGGAAHLELLAGLASLQRKPDAEPADRRLAA